jgi:hypothetical protein
MNGAAKLARLSSVDPRVVTVCGSLTIDLSNIVGFGVVVMHTRGSMPARSPNCNMSHVSLWYCHLQSSSHHAAENSAPRKASGSVALNKLADAPFGHVKRRLLGS